MYKINRVVYKANDNTVYFLTEQAAIASGKSFTLELIPVYETYPIGEKHKATRRKLG